VAVFFHFPIFVSDFKAELMKRFFLVIFLSGITLVSYCQNLDKASNEKEVTRSIFDEALVNGKSYEWLRDLCQNIGGRLSGSPQAEQAVKWAHQIMDTLGLDSVFLQEVWVPHWERGEKEVGKLYLNGESWDVSICALGGSVSTPDGGIKANVIEVKGVEELKQLGKEKITGKNRVF